METFSPGTVDYIINKGYSNCACVVIGRPYGAAQSNQYAFKARHGVDTNCPAAKVARESHSPEARIRKTATLEQAKLLPAWRGCVQTGTRGNLVAGATRYDSPGCINLLGSYHCCGQHTVIFFLSIVFHKASQFSCRAPPWRRARPNGLGSACQQRPRTTRSSCFAVSQTSASYAFRRKPRACCVSN